MSDKVDATAALGHSETAGIKHSPCEVIPAGIQRPDECPEVPSPRNGKHAGHVFPDNPPGTVCGDNMDETQGQSAAIAGQSGAFSGDAEILAGCSADNEINHSTAISVDVRHVPKVRDVGKAPLKQRTGKGINLGKSLSHPAERLPGHAGRLDAGAEGQIAHG